MRLARGALTLALVLVLAACATETETPAPEEAAAAGGGKIPTTSSSPEAIEHYLEGRDLAEKLRAPDARARFEQALALDDGFALAHLGMANTSPSARDFFDSLERAEAAAGGASEGERWVILAARAGSDGDPEAQSEHLRRLVEEFPADERAHNLIGNLHFGRQEYARAIRHFTQATEINRDYSPPYNSLGYSERALGNYGAAEEAFKKYIEILPGEPNPYDSYAELLMKLGRYQESIENYRQALEKDETFVASYVGIGNNHIFLGQGEEARASFQQLFEVARNDGQRRQARFWTAVSHLHEGDWDAALQELERRYEIAAASDDKATLSADLALAGNVLLEKGDLDAAAAKFEQAVAMIEEAEVTEDVKEGTRRNSLFNQARVALAAEDLETAAATAEEYGRQVAVKKIPFEVRRTHDLAGAMALQRADYDAALIELEQANQQNPRILYLQALACQGKGDAAGLEEFAARVANFNQLNINLAYVKKKAEELAGQG